MFGYENVVFYSYWRLYRVNVLMASLTLTAYHSRRLIKYGGSSILAFTFFIHWCGMGCKSLIAAHPPHVEPNISIWHTK
jgi:uncharacterized membrane protein YhaH (DUF805 family)